MRLFGPGVIDDTLANRPKASRVFDGNYRLLANSRIPFSTLCVARMTRIMPIR